MEILRAPDERFADLEGWPYEPRYADIGSGLRMHYVDEGPRDGALVLLTHGEPTWAYLYRKMIPGLVAGGHRVIAPDLIGFGRSDKPSRQEDYTYATHLEWFGAFVDALDLSDITMFCQDWGGLIGIVHAAHHPKRYRGIVAANTGVPLGIDIPMPEDHPFFRWYRQAKDMNPFSASWSVGGDSALNQSGHQLTRGEAAAYDAPFPEEAHCAGARRFPDLVVLRADHPDAPLCRDAWERLRTFDRPLLTAFGEREDVTDAFAALFQTGVPGAEDRNHVVVPGAGHFLQEHAPEYLVETTARFAAETA